MHEFGIAQSVLEAVEEKARPYEGGRVTRIKLRIGRLNSVTPDALRSAFEVISRGGVAEGAFLEIEEIPVTLKCHHCHEIITVDHPRLTCPRCNGTDIEMISGREVELQSMEMEGVGEQD